MATKQHACYTVTCDICGAEHENDSSGVIQHYEDPEHAAEDARDDDWAATEDAVRAVCPAGDEAHDAAYTEVWTEHEAQESARRTAAEQATPTTQSAACPCRAPGQDGDGRVRYQARDGEFVNLPCRSHVDVPTA